MKVTVCIGSSCHIKGSRQVVEGLQYLIAKEGLGDKVELGGTFCMGKCQQGVCVTVDDNFFSVTPDTVKEFFDKEIKAKVGRPARAMPDYGIALPLKMYRFSGEKQRIYDIYRSMRRKLLSPQGCSRNS